MLNIKELLAAKQAANTLAEQEPIGAEAAKPAEQEKAALSPLELIKQRIAAKAAEHQVVESSVAPTPVPAPVISKQLTGAAAVLASLRTKSSAKAPATKVVVAEVEEQKDNILPIELQEEDNLAMYVKEHSSIEVYDAQGKSLGLFTWQELNGKIAQLHKLAEKMPSLTNKLAIFQAKRDELVEMAATWAEQNKVKKEEPLPSIAAEETKAPDEQALPAASVPVEDNVASQETFALDIKLNEQQLAAKEMALAGKTFCLIGPAGTGKTTAQRAVGEALLDQGQLTTINFSSKGEALMAPSFAACAFTRRASGNLRRAIHKDPKLSEAFKHNIMTIHALLEYEPVYYYDDVLDKETMRFLPRRNKDNPLELTHLVIEEASMVGAFDLWQALYEALPTDIQIIFIGDINQLPPVFGASILNYALIQLPIIELTTVYRQKEGSGILDGAHAILRGEMPQEADDVIFVQGKNEQAAGAEKTALALDLMFQQFYKMGKYDPEEDMILSPYNEQALGTINLNKIIAQFLGRDRNAVVFEVVAGFNKHYLAIGDKVLVEKRDGIIVDIIFNSDYTGKMPQAPGPDLTRYGTRIVGAGGAHDLDEEAGAYAHFDLDKMMEDAESRKVSASHTVIVELEGGNKVELNTAGDFGPASFGLGYVQTAHKAQGCEWRKVFIVYHPSHRTMIFREWIYTAWTRAREELYIIGKKWLVEKATQTPRIQGNSIKMKIEYFNAKLDTKQANVFAYK